MYRLLLKKKLTCNIIKEINQKSIKNSILEIHSTIYQ